MVKRKNVSALVASLLLSILFLWTAPTAQADASDDAAALQSFKTFMQYLKNQDGRAWSLFSTKTQNLIIDMSVEEAIQDSEVQSMMRSHNMSRQELRELMKHELANPNSESSKSCWAEVYSSLPSEVFSQIDFRASVNGNVGKILLSGIDFELFTMVKENGKWKLDLSEVFEGASGSTDGVVDSDDDD
ncbi:MAG: hypothetical protein ACI38Q_06270 [Candidatus Bruticola sp.]